MAGVNNSKPDEFVVRVPKIVASKTKKIAIFKFNSNLNVDATQWSANNVCLSREDNESTFVQTDNQPKTGVGSEFGRQMREEARRKKMGYGTTKYSRHDQPWLLSVNSGSGPSKSSKKYRGIREGGVTQNADFWVFVKAGDGIFDAYPVNEWYNFLPVARYKTLDVEEAEEQFLKRNKILNQFALKIKQKLEEGGNGTNEDTKNNTDSETSKDKKRGKVEDGDDDGVSSKKTSKASKKGKKKTKKPKKRKETGDDDDLYASADSDDGDDEGREVDYMSDSDLSRSSDEEPEEVKVRGALIGVDEEDGMRKLIASEDENEENEQEEEEGEEKKKFDDFAKMESMPTIGADAEDKASDSGSDSDDPDEDLKSPFFMQDVKSNVDLTGKKSNEPGTSNLPSTSRSNADNNLKKKPISDEARSLSPPSKRAKTEKDAAKSGGAISEEEVRRYLQRKPQSSKDLVAKFKPKCQGMSKSDVVKCLADILKRLNPEQFERNGTMFFSMKK